ncbi:hypothetical protein T03_7724 [Trichinella britovi]|uniref:Uncharacterized protein n=1 Tax=Trichinella britovi TaxID=45882 RepID=A0A0V1D5H2_TRIBR|nr:hypothetical protein T03_7724 [Trichinella britovi]
MNIVQRCHNCTRTARRSYPSLLDSVSCATSYGAPSLHHSFSFTLFTNDPVEETNRIPGRAFVLFCSCECATNLPDSCWSVQPHYGHFKAEVTPGGNTLIKTPFHFTQHFSFRNRREQSSPAKILMPSSFPPFFLLRHYSYNQCWDSCLEWSGLRLFRNYKKISPDQVRCQVLPLWNATLQISGYTREPQILLPGRMSWVSPCTDVVYWVPGLVPRWKIPRAVPRGFAPTWSHLCSHSVPLFTYWSLTSLSY